MTEEPRYRVSKGADKFRKVGELTDGRICDLLSEFDYKTEVHLTPALAQAVREKFEVKVRGDEASEYSCMRLSKQPLNAFDGLVDDFPVLDSLLRQPDGGLTPVIELGISLRTEIYASYLYSLMDGKLVGKAERPFD